MNCFIETVKKVSELQVWTSGKSSDNQVVIFVLFLCLDLNQLRKLSVSSSNENLDEDFATTTASGTLLAPF